MKKKKIVVVLLLASFFLTSITALAAEWHRNGSYVKNVENWHQLTYTGSVRAKKGNRMAQITYYRSGKNLGGAYAFVDSWNPATYAYDSRTIWDSLNPGAPKTTFTYNL